LGQPSAEASFKRAQRVATSGLPDHHHLVINISHDKNLEGGTFVDGCLRSGKAGGLAGELVNVPEDHAAANDADGIPIYLVEVPAAAIRQLVFGYRATQEDVTSAMQQVSD
jgi:hypothetical protein